MKRNKVVQIILSLMVKLKIKDKRIRYVVLAVLGIALAASTQLTNLEGEISTVEPSKSAVTDIVEKGVEEAAGKVIGDIIDSLF